MNAKMEKAGFDTLRDPQISVAWVLMELGQLSQTLVKAGEEDTVMTRAFADHASEVMIKAAIILCDYAVVDPQKIARPQHVAPGRTEPRDM